MQTHPYRTILGRPPSRPAAAVHASRAKAVQGMAARDHQQTDGPNMIVLLFALALAVGLLIGIGAHQLSRPRDGRLPSGTLSAAAIDLGYKTERDFQTDNQRAELALGHVLAAGPGAQELWENAETGNRGLIWASEESRRGDGAMCRNLARRTLINGAFRNAAGTACRTEASDWKQSGKWHAE